MDDPPPGDFSDILGAYQKWAVEIRATWDRIHG